MVFSLGGYAQKKIIAQARANIKSGNNLENAEETLRGLLKDSVNYTNEKIWLNLFFAIKKQYDQGNEKLYLKQQYDTTRLFRDFRRMYEVMESLDSIAIAKNPKNQKYRKRYAPMLNQYRPNLFNGGIYFINKRDYVTAFDFFDEYISCGEKDLFKTYDYQHTDQLLPKAASYAVYCGYKSGNVTETLKYADIAYADTSQLDYLLQYLAETYKIQGDTLRYVETLHRVFNQYPRFMFFFPRLVEYYMSVGELDKAMVVCQQALEVDPKDRHYQFAQSTVYFEKEEYEKCISLCDQLIEENDSLADAYYYAGMAYFYMGKKLDDASRTSRKNRSKIQSLYRKAIPYLQRARILLPDEKKWALPLYTIYLSLNMGPEFEEMDKLLKNENQK